MRCLAPFLLLVSFCAPAGAQITAPPPDGLLDAGHCLATTHQDWLGLEPMHPFDLELGYVDDLKAYRGDDLLYVVQYTTPTHSEGMVYIFLAHSVRESVHTFLTHGRESHQTLSLRYRTSFRQSDDGSAQIQLINPPLGGVWTQDRIVSAIHQVGFHTWSVPVSELQDRSGAFQCEAAPDNE